mgnify:CR=1 FL=1
MLTPAVPSLSTTPLKPLSLASSTYFSPLRYTNLSTLPTRNGLHPISQLHGQHQQLEGQCLQQCHHHPRHAIDCLPLDPFEVVYIASAAVVFQLHCGRQCNLHVRRHHQSRRRRTCRGLGSQKNLKSTPPFSIDKTYRPVSCFRKVSDLPSSPSSLFSYLS